jgi:hypothetical protein
MPRCWLDGVRAPGTASEVRILILNGPGGRSGKPGAATLAAVALLMAVAHPAAPARDTDDDDDDDSAYDLSSAADWDDGDDDPWGRYCLECGANSHYECDCPCPVCGAYGEHDCVPA